MTKIGAKTRKRVEVLRQGSSFMNEVKQDLRQGRYNDDESGRLNLDMTVGESLFHVHGDQSANKARSGDQGWT